MNRFSKEISASEARYQINSENGEINSSGGAQGSYNLPIEFLNYSKKIGVLVEDEIEYSRKYKDGNAYVLAKDYKLELGKGILWLIGDEYKEKDNKFITSIGASNGKLQMFRTVYSRLNAQNYEWFVKLYDKNLSGNNLTLSVDSQTKVLCIDIEFRSVKNSIKKEELDKKNINNKINFQYNRIIFGAPGTGKSHKINEDKEIFEDRYERVTFHPNYSYAQFVGTYKPVPSVDNEGKDSITYTYVPGPFMRTYIKAVKAKETDSKPCLLIIEEINRANVAAVFGDIFQLLDRKDGESEYSIETSEDIRKYLACELYNKRYSECSEEEKNKCRTMKIPSNMYIWATMNSADQGVYPMDTAFKRRWSFEYIGIDENEEEMSEVNIILPGGMQRINWNKLRKAINKQLSSKNISEDKLLGPYFLSSEIIKINENSLDNIVEDNDRFTEEFESKVLMYLFEDVCKQHKDIVFNNNGHDIKRYSSICDTFEKEGLGVFVDNIVKSVEVTNVIPNPKETEGNEPQNEVVISE